MNRSYIITTAYSCLFLVFLLALLILAEEMDRQNSNTNNFNNFSSLKNMGSHKTIKQYQARVLIIAFPDESHFFCPENHHP